MQGPVGGISDEAGATLVELVVAIAVSAVLAGTITSFMARPLNAYADARLRATLVDSGDAALGRMKRDVRLALPNSVRVSPDGGTLEILHTVDGARYRRAAGTNPSGTGHTAPSDWLEFTASDSQWNVLGRLTHLTFTYGTALPASYRLAIYPTSSSVWSEAASGTVPATITPNGTAITVSNDGDEDQISLSIPFRFARESPRQRMYVVDGPVTFRCDPAAHSLTRFSNYLPSAAQPTDPTSAPLAAASSAMLTGSLTSCRFRFDTGTAVRAGVLSIDLELSEGTERVRVLDQVHVENAP